MNKEIQALTHNMKCKWNKSMNDEEQEEQLCYWESNSEQFQTQILQNLSKEKNVFRTDFRVERLDLQRPNADKVECST